MLASLRRGSKSLVVKVLMVLLLLTFAFWGVGDIIRNHNQNIALKVGETSFSYPEFNQLFNEQIAAFENQMNSKIPQDNLNNPIFRQFILNQLINKTLILQESASLGLLVSDDMIKYEIANIPLFIKDDKFNKELFDSFLKNANLSEKKFISLLKNDISAQNINTFFSTTRYAPAMIVNNVSEAKLSIREINLVSIPSSIIKVNNTPLPEELEKTYNDNSQKFTIPESRDVSYLTFGIKDISVNLDNMETHLREQYEAQKTLFQIAEKRKVNQLVFNDREKANKAFNLIKAGKSFQEVGKQFFPEKKTFELGEITKDGLQEDIGSAIFTLKENVPSEVLESPLGYHIFQVTKITPSSVKTFEDVKEELKKSLVREKQFERLNEIAQEIDQMILSGSTLDEINKKYNFPIQFIKNLSNSPKPESDNNLAAEPSFINAAFSNNENTLSSIIPYNENNNYFVLSVNKISPAVIKPLESVKAEVKDIWYKTLLKEKTSSFADTVYKSLNDGMSLNEAKKTYNLPEIKSYKVNSYSEELSKWSPALKNHILSTESGKFSPPVSSNDNEYVIINTVKITLPSEEEISKKSESVSLEVSQALPNEYYTQYIKYLRNKHLVEYDKRIIESNN